MRTAEHAAAKRASRRRRFSRRPKGARRRSSRKPRVAASEEGARLIAGAKAEIEQEVSRARETLRAQVAALAVAGAEQILRREVDAKVHAELLGSVQGQL